MPDIKRFRELGWDCDIEEISADVYRVHCADPVGRSVEMIGTEFDLPELLEQCLRHIKAMIELTES